MNNGPLFARTGASGLVVQHAHFSYLFVLSPLQPYSITICTRFILEIFFHSPNMPPKSDKSAQAALIRQKSAQKAHYRATNRLHLAYPPPPRLLLSPKNKYGHSPARSIFPGGVIAKNITRTRLSPRRPPFHDAQAHVFWGPRSPHVPSFTRPPST